MIFISTCEFSGSVGYLFRLMTDVSCSYLTVAPVRLPRMKRALIIYSILKLWRGLTSNLSMYCEKNHAFGLDSWRLYDLRML